MYIWVCVWGYNNNLNDIKKKLHVTLHFHLSSCVALHSWDNISLISWHTSLFIQKKLVHVRHFSPPSASFGKLITYFFGRRIAIDFLSNLYVLTQQNNTGQKDAEKITECMKIEMRVQECAWEEGLDKTMIFRKDPFYGRISIHMRSYIK